MNDSVRVITDRYAKLTLGEKRIADYCIGHISEVAYLTARELAEHVDLSEATISRFCQTLGFTGFRQFKIAIAMGSSKYDDYVVDYDLSEDSLEQSIQRVALASAHSIRSTVDSLDLKAVREVAERIASCRRLTFVGFGTSAVVCEDAVIKFTRLNIASRSFGDPHLGAAALSLCDELDVVIAISHSGTTTETLRLARIAKEHGAFTVGVTTYPEEAITRHCDLVLKTVTRESPLHSSAITSRMSQLAVIDSIFMTVVSLGYAEVRANLEKVGRTMRDYRHE